MRRKDQKVSSTRLKYILDAKTKQEKSKVMSFDVWHAKTSVEFWKNNKILYAPKGYTPVSKMPINNISGNIILL